MKYKEYIKEQSKLWDEIYIARTKLDITVKRSTQHIESFMKPFLVKLWENHHEDIDFDDMKVNNIAICDNHVIIGFTNRSDARFYRWKLQSLRFLEHFRVNGEPVDWDEL